MMARWARWRSLELRAGLAFLVLVPLLLVALALWFGSEYRRLGSVENDARRSHARSLLFSELLSSLKDAETGQRGFVITGDDAFLLPYRNGVAVSRGRFAALARYPAPAAEMQRLERVDHLMKAKFDEIDRVIALRRSQGLAAAAAAVSEGAGKRIMDDIRREGFDARAFEAAQLTRTLARQRARTNTTQAIIWGVVVVVTLTFLGLGLLLWRGEQQRYALQRIAGEAAARRRAIFDNTLDAIVLINPSGSIEAINRSASRMFGYSDAQLIRRDISLIVDLAPGDGAFLVRIGLGPDGLAEPFRHSLSARRADGVTFAVEAALGTMPLPDGMHIVAALRDVAEREKVERIKDQFLSTVSHELRTPLTSIVGSLGLLRGGTSDELSAGAQRLLVIAESNAKRLIRLVNDLLDIEKLEAGEMTFEFEPIDLHDVAEKAIDAVRGMALSQHVEIAFLREAEPVIVRGDLDRLIQVFTNLLGNAIRFTPAEGVVTLGVRRRANHAEAGVTDQGPGVDAELRGRLFTRFAQSMQAPVGQSRGTGLGLAISREIVRSHGGGIWYEPAAQGGSVFSFNLPLWNVATEQPDAEVAPRVLICASPSEAAGIVAALADRAIRADVIAGPAELPPALARRGYLALLLDCSCVGDDPDALLDLRDTLAFRRLPIVAIADGAERRGGLASLDVVDWIARPLDPEQLNAAMARIVARAADGMPLILHVDDDTDTLEVTAAALRGRARVVHATDIASARAVIARDRPDMVIVDLALPDGSGDELLADLAPGGDHATPTIIYSAQERNAADARDVTAVLTKSKRSLSALVETVNDILDRNEHPRARSEKGDDGA
jgi:PAS domain S-box-containing protein